MPVRVTNTPSDSNRLTSRLRWIPQAASAGVVVVGGLVLVGWWLDIAALKSQILGFHAIKANTALTFILAGLSLWWSHAESTSGWKRGISQVCAAIVALAGLLTLSEYLFAWDVGIDQLLVTDLQEITEPYHAPGRMAFVSALNFLLLGGALLLLDVKSRCDYQHAPFLAVVAAVSACLSLVAYLYGGVSIHQVYPLETVAPYTAVLFLALAVGILFARPQHRFVGIMTSDTAAATATRRLMLLTIVLPIFLGWMRLMGERQGLYGMEFGLALMALLAIVGLTGGLYWQAKSLIQGEEYQRGINEVSAILSGLFTLEDAFPCFAAVITKIVSRDRICVIIREGEKLVATLSVADPPLQCFQGKTWRALGETAVEWVMDHKVPRLIRDLTLEQRFADEVFVAGEGIRSALILPLLVGGETVGAMVLDSRTPGAYTEAHVTLLSGFMEPLASAIRNAQLHAEVVRYSHDLERLVEARTRELQTANGHLAEVSRHKSAFLANMSHELRTPLNAILGFSDLLRDPAFGPLTSKQARYTDHIQSSGRHLLILINDLLDLSKVEAGKLILRPEPFDLSEALAAALRDIHPLADPKQLTLTLDADTAPTVLTADPVRFKQILYNLLSNAVKFTPEGGQVTVAARRVSSSESQPQNPPVPPFDKGGVGGFHNQGISDFVEIAVIDTGVGIAAEDLPKLFERYSQLETTKQSQGTGLGLALIKHLIELHGGTIAVTSASPGQGSRFTVRFPLTPSAAGEVEEGC